MCRSRPPPFRSQRSRVGHARPPHRVQIAKSLSCATGYRTPSRFDASTTFACGFSQKNSGLWTPTTVSPNDAYRSCHARNCGITLRQLIQPYVQNSTRTTRARRPGIVRGSLLIHGCPAMSGAGSPSRSAWPAAAAAPNPTSAARSASTERRWRRTATASSPSSSCRPASSCYRPSSVFIGSLWANVSPTTPVIPKDSPAATTTPTRVNQPVSLRAPASLDGWSPVVWAVSLSRGWRSRSPNGCEIFVPAARREWSDDLVGPGGGLAEPPHRVRREPPVDLLEAQVDLSVRNGEEALSLAISLHEEGAESLDLEHPEGLGDSELRSEEHTSELQSRLHLVCRLLLEKKKTATLPTTAGQAGL